MVKSERALGQVILSAGYNGEIKACPLCCIMCIAQQATVLLQERCPLIAMDEGMTPGAADPWLQHHDCRMLMTAPNSMPALAASM